MQIYNILRAAVVAVVTTTAIDAAAYNPLPRDPAVVIDTLDNGLTVILRHNDRPEGQADFFLAQRVGSVNENEDQRGLAHFLEHMCFNGTRHFPGNSLIDYLESIGVKFGANLNAYTSTDETVYNICDVPAGRTSAVDSCLLILRDWSGDLLLNDKDIDEERGVIVGEWRQRQGSANSRLLEKAIPHIYPNSPYGQRMPIGLMSVVRNFKPEVLRAYYEKWYHPANQCVIVVGDIDTDAVLAQIRKLWADVPALQPGQELAPEIKIADNAGTIATVQSDPEQQGASVQLYIKHEGVADDAENTILELREDLAADLALSMLAERFDELEQSPEAPFTNLGIGDVKFLMSRTSRAMTVRANAKTGRTAETAALIGRELQRAARHGFTATELQRAKLDARAQIDNEFAERANVTNTQYARRYVRYFLDGGELSGAEQKYKMMRGVLGQVNLDSVNNYVSRIVRPGGYNAVVVAYVPENDAEKLTDSKLAAAYTCADSETLQPYVDTFAGKPLLAKLPAPGKIVSEKAVPQFGAKEWKLSNGARVVLKQTDYKADQVYVQAYSPGGLSQNFDPARGAEYHLLEHVLPVCGAGDMTATEIRRSLAGKRIKSDIKIDNMDESMGLNTTPADLETGLQLMYLKATDLRPDPKAFATVMENQRMRRDANRSNPVHIMGDSIHANVYGGHILGKHVTDKELDEVSYDRIMDIYRDRFKDFSDFTFYVVGAFDEDSLRRYVETYIASLPGNGRMERPRDIGYRYVPGRVDKRWATPMEVPQTICYSFYNHPCEYTLDNILTGRALSQLIKTTLRRDLREKRGWTYGIQGHIGINAGMNGDDPASLLMPVYIRVSPENADSTFAIVDATVRAMADPANINAADLEAVKSQMLKNIPDNRRDNGYWIVLMKAADQFGQDLNSDFEKTVNAMTPETVAAFARRYLVPASRMTLRMAPAEKGK